MTVEQCFCGLLLRVAASGKHQRQLSETETVLERLHNMVTKDVATTQIKMRISVENRQPRPEANGHFC